MKRLTVMLTAVLTALALAVPAGAGEQVIPEGAEPAPLVPDEWVNETPSGWFIQLASPPAVTGTAKAQLRAERNAFKAAARAAGIEYQELRSFETLFNGFSVNMNAGQLGRVTQLSGVAAVYPILEVQAPDVTSISPDLATAIVMTGADIAQNELGYTGAGVKVAVMDTGIDYDHPDLGGCFGDGCRVAYGFDFVGDAFNADPTDPSYNPTPSPDPDPDDCQGHGTHVAGIVGANGTAVGVAPDVTLGAYRVFGCDGSTTADIMIAAMEAALADGMDVLNMSIGSAFTWPQYPTAVASNLLVDAGMVVVASIGNSGSSGTYSAGAPGLGEKVIGVASFDNTNVALNTFTISPDDTPIGYGNAAAAPVAPTSGTYPMARTGDVTATNDACSALPADSLAGHVALIRRGGCFFHTKALNAMNAGAVAVVLYNNVGGRFSPTVAGDPPITIPVVAISDAEGALIDSRLASGPVDMTWTEETGIFENPTAGLISSFSSYGLAPDLTLKPDIGAPGGLIMSTYPLEQGGYATISGTSMAAPHVAGAAALLLEARPDTPTALVRAIFQNSADPALWNLAPGFGLMEPVHRQGAGMIDIDDSITQTNIVTPGKIATGESEAGSHSEDIRLWNFGASDVTYTLGTMSAFGCCSAAIATTGTMSEELDYWLSAEVVEFSATEVTVPAGGYADVTVTIHPEPTGGPFVNVQYGGWITVMPDDGSDVLRVPYGGFLGDYQSLEVLTPGSFGVFPSMGVTADGNLFGLVPDGWVYSMEGFDVPNVLLHLHHQSRMLTIDVYDAKTGQPVHPVFHTFSVDEYLPRNATSGGFFAFPWDGTRLHSEGVAKEMRKDVADGEYYVVVTVLKALGDPANPDHWEHWTSTTFVIDRPDVREGKKPRVNAN